MFSVDIAIVKLINESWKISQERILKIRKYDRDPGREIMKRRDICPKN